MRAWLTPEIARERFLARVDRSNSVGCWLWPGAINNHGYGRVFLPGRAEMYAHRYAWGLAFGAVPDGLRVLHHCDNPPCVKTEPDELFPRGHLFLGTQAENLADCITKGRARRNPLRGSRSPTAKLTEADVVEMRRLVAAGEPRRSVSAAFGVSESLLEKIVLRVRWAHV